MKKIFTLLAGLFIIATTASSQEECIITEYPYVATFDPGTTDCWTLIDVDENGYDFWGIILAAFSYDIDWFDEGNYTALYTVDSFGDAVANDWLVSPPLELPALSEMEVSFDYFVGGAESVEKFSVWLITGTPENYENGTELLSTQTVDNADWESINPLNLADYAGQTVYIGIKVESDAHQGTIYFDNFTVNEKEVSGVKNNTIYNGVNIYPSPTSSSMKIVADSHIEKTEIFSITGQLISAVRSSSSEIEVNTSGFPTGTYVVRVITENGIVNKKVIIAK